MNKRGIANQLTLLLAVLLVIAVPRLSAQREFATQWSVTAAACTPSPEAISDNMYVADPLSGSVRFRDWKFGRFTLICPVLPNLGEIEVFGWTWMDSTTSDDRASVTVALRAIPKHGGPASVVLVERSTDNGGPGEMFRKNYFPYTLCGGCFLNNVDYFFQVVVTFYRDPKYADLGEEIHPVVEFWGIDFTLDARYAYRGLNLKTYQQWKNFKWVRMKPPGRGAEGDDMQAGEALHPGQSISSANGKYRFVYQWDMNLVLYQRDPYKVLWDSRTYRPPSLGFGICIMQDDGNLVIYDGDGKPIWASNTRNPDSRLVVQDDGNVVIYRPPPNNTPVWATNTVQP